MANVRIYTKPIGSQLTSTIVQDEDDSKNDFDVFLAWDENVELSEENVSVDIGSIVAFDGRNSVYKATIRPQQTAGMLTLTVAQNAVSQGNPETSQTIRLSTSFPDADAATPTLLFDTGKTSTQGIAVSPTRILISDTISLDTVIHKFTHTGTEMTGERIEARASDVGAAANIDYLNGDVLLGNPSIGGRVGRYRLNDFSEVERYTIPTSTSRAAVVATELGITLFVTHIVGTGSVDAYVLPWRTPRPYTEADLEHSVDVFRGDRVTEQGGLLYHIKVGGNTIGYGLAEIVENTINRITPLNISDYVRPDNKRVRDLYAYRDTLFILNIDDEVHTVDIRPYRPLSKNTKTAIYPIFANEGDTIDLTQFAPDAEHILFDVGYKKPPFLSINANNELVVSSSAVTETTPVLVQCLGINRIDAQPFSFYIIIIQASNPVWREISSLSMRAGSSINLFDFVDADSISFRAGRTRPPNSTLSNGIFTIDTTGGNVSFTARKGSRTTHTQFDVHVIQQTDPANFSDIFRHHVEIGGIDVSADVSEFPTVSKSLDSVALNEYRADSVRLTLKSGSSNNFKYNDDVDGNFWETNGLNAGGFQVPIHISVESLVEGVFIRHLLFAGVITNATANFNNTRVELRCVDIAKELQNTLIQDFGTLEKYDTLRQKTDEATFQGIYAPESSLLPMQTHNAQAWSHLTKLIMRQLALPSEGPPIQDAAYLTPQELFTSGGFREDNPILRFKAQPRSEDVRYLVNQIALNKKVYNVEIDLPSVSVSNPYILNRGSIPFSVENIRTTRLLTDWVYDTSNDRLLMLLSNPENHVADVLVEYRLDSDAHRVLHTFAKDIAVHRIARRNGSNYYFLTSAKIPQDRSASQLPRPSDSTGYAYDSLAEGSEIKIYHYNTTSGNLTEHVAEDDTRPPQLGIHYWIGFENGLYVDTFEGIRPDDRVTFKWQSNNLYYRYAKDGEFGVARVNTSGTTTRMIHHTRLGDNNHLNFAFDVTSGGDIYFVYSETFDDALVYDGNYTTFDITNFNDDLSGIPMPVVLQISLRIVGVQLLNTAKLTITGTDISGSTITEDFDLNSYRVGSQIIETLTTTQSFATITRVESTGVLTHYQGSTLKITAVIGSALSIQRRANNGTITTVFSDLKRFSELTDLEDAGGAYLGCHEALFHNNNLYMLCPIQRVDVDENTTPTTYSRSREKTAGMVLYRCNVTAGSPSLTVIEKWDYVHRAGCNLIVHDGAVHYMEHPPAAAQFKAHNPDLDGYWTDEDQEQTMGYNILPDPLGAVKKVTAAGAVESLGNLWHEERPYNVALTRCLSFGGDLHAVMGYGDPSQVLKFNSLASKPDNFQHLVFGNKLHYVVPEFDSNGSRYSLLADIAKKTNSTLSFREGLIHISDRDPFRALIDGNTGTGTGNLNFDNSNKQFPSAGYLLIGKEILKYTGISGGAFTGIQRGVLGTEVSNHANNTPLFYLDTVIDPLRIKEGISIATDTTRTYNVIRNSENTIEEPNPDSIDTYGELPYTLDLGLTSHEAAWQEHVFKSYIANLKDPHPLVSITLIPTNYLELGQFTGFRNAAQVYGVQIVSITYSKDATTIRGRVL